MVSRIDFSEVAALEKYRLTWEKSEILHTYEFEGIEPDLYTQLINNFNILEDKKVYNHYLYGLYKLHKEEKKITGGSVKTEKLFHATSTRNAMSIIQNNFDWGKTGRCRFGQGVCFSPYPNYANKYASSTGVLVGGIQEVGVNYDLKVPCDPEADTTVCYRNEVYVKYYDYEFYPIYVVEYKFNKN